MDQSIEGSLNFRPGRPEDLPVMVSFIKMLADHEGRPELATLTPDSLGVLLYGEDALGEAYLLSEGDEILAFALISERFTSFRSRRYLYIEDMMVLPKAQGRGLGRRMLAFLGGLARSRGHNGLEWSALSSNTQALRFYEAVGAETETGVVYFSLKDQRLDAFLNKEQTDE